jgi:hypothetical protein
MACSFVALAGLNAASRVLAIELHCGDGVFTKPALELGKAFHFCDDAMVSQL